jgi:hypothetical protein
MTDRHHEIDELADRLDTVLPPDSEQISPDIADDDVLLQIAARLASEQHPQPSFEAMARMQAQMLSAQHALKTASPRTSASGGRILTLARRSLAAVASIVLVLFFASPLVAQSVPGDLLYPAKITFEQIELGLASVVGDPAAVYLSHAKSRAAEAVKLAQRDSFSSDLIEDAAEEIEQAAENVDTDAGPAPEYAGKLAEIDALIDLAIAEALQDAADQSDVVRASTVIDRVRLGGDYQALGGTYDEGSAVIVAPPDNSDMPQVDAIPDIVEGTEEAPNVIEIPTTASPAPIIATIIGDGKINLRQRPGLDQSILVQLNPGALVQIIRVSDDEEWVQVRLPDGTEGWVAEFLVAVGQIPTTASGAQSGAAPNAGGSIGGAGNPQGNNSDFDCGQPGNACNAPGTQNNDPNENGERGRS